MTPDSDTAIQSTEEVESPLTHLVSEYGRSHAFYFAAGLSLQTLGQIPGRVPGLVIGVAFDAVFRNTGAYTLPVVPAGWIPGTRAGQFWFSVAVIAVSYLLGSLLSVGSSLAYSWFNQHLLYDVRTASYDALQRLSVGFFDDEQTGELVSILNNDVDNLESFTLNTFSTIIQFPLSVAIAFAFMFWLNWQLALVLLFVPILIAASSFLYSRLIAPYQEELRSRVGTLNSRLENNISGIATIKAYTTENTERGRVEDASWRRVETRLKMAKLYALSGPLATTIQNLGIVAVILVAGYWILAGPPLFFEGSITAGALVTFIFYVRTFVGPMRRLPGIVDNYQSARASAKRVVRLLALPDVVPEADDAVELETVSGRVEYEDVRFVYETGGEEVVRGISFAADAGETIGIVGPTGAGKSTLLKLLLRFYDPDAGTIRIDDHDVRDVTVQSLRESVGYVGQEPFLFYGTIAENIAYGTKATDEEVRRAAKRAGAHEFITALSNGYETEVGERGLKLSGGQRQRVAIARAVVRDPDILVLDEATSHVDNETEALIQRNLETLTEDRTTFVIAHRLSTVRNADTILAMADGQIVERGAHDELLDANGLYANLWRVQVGDVASLPEEFIEETRRRQRGTSE